MSAVTKEWLDSQFMFAFDRGPEGQVINSYWDCGVRDESIGLLRARVMDFGNEEYAIEISQSVDGEFSWCGGICVPVAETDEVLAIIGSVIHKRTGGV